MTAYSVRDRRKVVQQEPEEVTVGYLAGDLAEHPDPGVLMPLLVTDYLKANERWRHGDRASVLNFIAEAELIRQLFEGDESSLQARSLYQTAGALEDIAQELLRRAEAETA